MTEAMGVELGLQSCQYCTATHEHTNRRGINMRSGKYWYIYVHAHTMDTYKV